MRDRIFIGLMATMVSASAGAELPDASILDRYGISSDQLPVAQARSRVSEADASAPRFVIRPEKPWVSVSLGEGRKPDMTGNISIDRSTQQEHERCLRLQDQSLQRRGGWVNCDEGGPMPGMGTGFTR